MSPGQDSTVALWEERVSLGVAVLPSFINIHRSSSRCMLFPECTKP